MKNSNVLVQQISNAVLKIGGFLAVAAVVVTVTNTKLSQLREQAAEQSPAVISVAERTRQLNCLTKNIYWEAGSEPFEGKVAVAQVTMNRVDSGRFAPDICGVVYQKISYMKSWFASLAGTATEVAGSNPYIQQDGVKAKKWPNRSYSKDLDCPA